MYMQLCAHSNAMAMLSLPLVVLSFYLLATRYSSVGVVVSLKGMLNRCMIISTTRFRNYRIRQICMWVSVETTASHHDDDVDHDDGVMLMLMLMPMLIVMTCHCAYRS